jgi:hypothetical protein
MTLKQVQKIANIANKMLVTNELIKQIDNGKIEPWSPVNIIIEAVDKDYIQEALSNYLGELKQELKEDIITL